MNNIIYVDASQTLISDVGLKHLTRMKKLTHLFLFRTRVTNIGLKHLERLPTLVFLDLRQTKVTAAGVQSLRKALPNCEIRFKTGRTP
jgi:hypothetical protein